MSPLNTAILLNILGFAVGTALYSLLLVMVWRHRRTNSRLNFLLVLTAVLGLLWNGGELFSFILRDFVQNPVPVFLTAASYSALGFLPSVVVHSAESENRKSRILTIAAYVLSAFAAILHFREAAIGETVPSNLGLQLLTFGSLALVAGLLFFNLRQKLENKTVWIAALSVFAVSSLHLSSDAEGANWFIELVAHQSSLPLALAILIQDYRFAFADLFLKRAFSLLLLSLSAFSLYVFVAQPLGALHATHEENDTLAIVVTLVLWIVTALLYPFLHQFSVWLVDKILLSRVSYEDLLGEISRSIEGQRSNEDVLSEVSGRLGSALTAGDSSWEEIQKSSRALNLPVVEVAAEGASIEIPTSEKPFYAIRLDRFRGGRKLLSEEVQMLEAVSLLTARRIDAQRVVDERFEQESREQEYAKLATEAQLVALRAQVNPHFLFNALTTIGYLIQTSPDKAFRTLMKLTKLLRSVLKSDGEFADLGDELNLIENYLEIEKARFEERLNFEIDVAEELLQIRIPSLILQPLVENAVKHGISENKKGGKVKIEARLEKKGVGVFLRLSVLDSGSEDLNLGFENSNGVGLKNIRERLRSYYGQDAELKFDLVNQQTLAELKIPVNGSVATLKR